MELPKGTEIFGRLPICKSKRVNSVILFMAFDLRIQIFDVTVTYVDDLTKTPCFCIGPRSGQAPAAEASLITFSSAVFCNTCHLNSKSSVTWRIIHAEGMTQNPHGWYG